jgi:hypothetical protein
VTEEASRPGVPTEETRATPREPFPQVARGRRVHLASRAVIAIALVLLAIVAWLVGRKGTSPSAEAAPPPPAFCAPPVAIQILSRNISDQSPAAKLAGALRKAGCSVELNRPDDSAAAVPDSKVVFFHDTDKGKANALRDYVRAQVTLLVEDRMKWAQGRKIPDGHLDIWMKG